MKRKSYPSDLSDAEWQIIEPLIPPAKTGGGPRKQDMREIVNAIFYLLHVGCPWRMLPHDFPPWQTVYYYFAQWREDETFKRIMLRRMARSNQGSGP